MDLNDIQAADALYLRDGTILVRCTQDTKNLLGLNYFMDMRNIRHQLKDIMQIIREGECVFDRIKGIGVGV
jgi:hypothetical protein